MRAIPKQLLGRWVHTSPEDSDDYVCVYEVALDGDQIVVSGEDLQDGEKFEISGVTWDGNTLRFVSLMPSTGRTGIHEFRLKDKDTVDARFTFTVQELMKRYVG